MGNKIIQMKDLSIADLKAAYDFNAMKMKSLKKSLKASGTVDYQKNGDYQDLLVYKLNFYKELENRINSVEVVW